MNSVIRGIFKKGIAAGMAVSVAAYFGGCMLFDKIDYEMTDAGIYLARALKHHDAEEILDLDLDEAEERRAELRTDLDFSTDGPYMPGNASVYDSICATMRYYIVEDSVYLAPGDRSGEADFVFELKDYKQVRRDREYMTDPVTFTTGLVACEDVIEIEVTMEFELDGGEWKVTNFNDVYDEVFSFLGEEFEFISPLQGKIRSLDWVNGDVYDTYNYYSYVSSIELDLTPIGHDEAWDDVFYIVSYSTESTEESFSTVYTGGATLNAVYGSAQGADMRNGCLKEGYYTITFLDGYGTVLDSSTCYVLGYTS